MFDPVIEGLPRLGVLAVLLAGVARVQSGAADAGDVVQVAFLFTLIGSRSGRSARSRASCRAAWSAGTGCSGCCAPDRWDGVRRGRLTSTKAARLQVRDLRFGNQPERDVLDGVDFTVEPGRTVAVVGPTGSGKSTLTTLLARLVDPEAARSSSTGPICGTWPATSSPGAVRGTATAFLFDDTIRGNITLGADLRRGRLGRTAGRSGGRLREGAARRPRHHGGGARYDAVRRPAATDRPGPCLGTAARAC